METLLYEKIRTIDESIVQFCDLVAVFSQREGDHLLQVYNSDHIPVSSVGPVETILLSDLPNIDLSEYDGPMVGFQGLDVVRDDLLTKGANFYSIERLFQTRDRQEELHQTMLNLAAHIIGGMADDSRYRQKLLRRRALSKALLLALPGILAERECQDLIAVLPASDLNNFIVNERCRLVYNHSNRPFDPTRLDLVDQPEWIVALDELTLFNPQVKSGEVTYLELRPLLRRAGKGEDLKKTLFRLSMDLMARHDQHPLFRTYADAMMMEYWLAEQDVEDLLFFSPNNDFGKFAECGEALLAYRVPMEDVPASPGLNIGLDRLLRNGLPQEYGRVVASLPTVFEMLDRDARASSVHDLGELIYKTGRTSVLGRTLWMYAQDLSTHGAVGNSWAQKPHSPSFEQVREMARRACSIYALSDPWEWRQGRWGLHLRASYKTLQDLLSKEAEHASGPLSTYYAAQRCWFACDLDEDIEGDLRKTQSYLTTFLRATRDQLHLGLVNQQLDAENLSKIVDAVLNASLGTSHIAREVAEERGLDQIAEPNVPEALFELACTQRPLPLLSSLFRVAWEKLMNARRLRQVLQSPERDVLWRITRLRHLAEDLRRNRGLLFAPDHERAVLVYAYQKEIDLVEKLLHDLETSAHLEVNLLNPFADLHKDVFLYFEVVNQGKVEARNLEIALTQKGFEFVDDMPIREIGEVAPGATIQLHYHLRPEQTDAEIRLTFDFNDLSGQPHRDHWTSQLYMRDLDEEPFRYKINHYQFGRPIQDPDDFYGRRVELRRILSRLEAGGKQNHLLRGARRMGKTSLLYMLQHALEHHATRRLFEIPADWDPTLDHVHPIFLSLHSYDLRDDLGLAGQIFRKLLESTFSALNMSNEVSTHAMAAYALRQTQVGPVNAALEQVELLFRYRPGERLVVFLDEFDEVYRPGVGAIDRYLRDFITIEQRMTWVVASTLGLVEEVKSISSPWFNVFEIIELDRLPRQASLDLVQASSRLEGVIWHSDAMLKLLAETGCHPAYTQLFCSRVIEHLNDQRTNYVLRDTITLLADQIIEERGTAHEHFEFFWADNTSLGQLILLILDEQDLPLKRDELRRRVFDHLKAEFGSLPHQRIVDSQGSLIDWGDDKFREGMKVLEKIVNAVYLDDQKRYAFSVPLFRRWLRQRLHEEDLMEATLDRIAKDMERDGLSYT